MEALFEIGKELGALEARVRSLETKRCGCGSAKTRKVSEAELPAEQRTILAEVRDKHATLVAGFNQVLKDLELADRVKIDGFQLARHRGRSRRRRPVLHVLRAGWSEWLAVLLRLPRLRHLLLVTGSREFGQAAGASPPR